MNYTTVGAHDFFTFLLVFSRLSALVSVAPPFNNKAVPNMVKVGLALILSMAVTPLAAPLTGPIPSLLLILVINVLKNVVFGLALGYIVQVLFSAVQMGGQIADLQMGFGFINTYNPFSETQESVMGTFQFQLALTLYILANGHLALMGAAADSFRLLPPTAIAPHASFGLAIIPMVKMMFVLGFRMALPALGVLLIADIAFGLVARLVPQINVFIVGAPAKIIFGLATITLVLPVMALIVGQIIVGTSEGLNALIAGAK